ncbi:unnamed protein product [Owenia fusiformis]|uniref:Uncharacterized protein n=1 Tax=Owenia fusiformis TaxID=6347 RepID=A0A8J1THN9_OWEFU|nr:unnamed protein product [Owenia fusiformis]
MLKNIPPSTVSLLASGPRDEYLSFNNIDDITRSEAEIRCMTHFGAVLAKVNSAADSATLSSIINIYGGKNVWIGAEKIGGSWYWHNDGSLVTWTNWDSPAGTKDCAYVNTQDMAWINIGCHEKAPIVACMKVHEVYETTGQQLSTEPRAETTTETTTAQPCTVSSRLITTRYAIDKKAVNIPNAICRKSIIARSKLECATKCLQITDCSCRAFLFNKSDRKCTLLESKVQLSSFVVDVGVVSYIEIDDFQENTETAKGFQDD